MSKSAKGSRFERRVCQLLSLWWSNGKEETLFWRTAGSGARATSRAKKSKGTLNAHGDIAATDPSSQPLIDFITFELKRGYNKFTIQDLLDKSVGAKEQKHEEWFRKAIQSSKLSKSSHWMVIVQRDRREALAFCDWGLAMALLPLNLVPLRIRVEVGVTKMVIACIPLKEFLNNVKPEQIRRLAEGRRQNELDRNPCADDSCNQRDSLASPPGQRPKRGSGKKQSAQS